MFLTDLTFGHSQIFLLGLVEEKILKICSSILDSLKNVDEYFQNFLTCGLAETKFQKFTLRADALHELLVRPFDSFWDIVEDLIVRSL